MTEGKIECPNCGSKNCFEEPLQNNVFSYLCVGCGYTSNTLLVPGTEIHNKAQKSNPKILNDLKYYDEERNIHWYPSVVNMGKLGIIYPDGTVFDWKWKFASVVKVDEEESKNYPIPGKDGEFYTERLDVENAVEFGQYEFLSACKTMGIVNDGLKNGLS